ncbi:MAG: ParB N-terminal domain-containing protein [Clostridia bacterium]|nr:ParB N-terminal domain-containing protein [Clostridia bacterium]
MNGITKIDNGRKVKAYPKGTVYIAVGRILPRARGSAGACPDGLTGLAESIRINGLPEPLRVRLTERKGVYELVSGERSYYAAKMLGMCSLPCVICEEGNADKTERDTYVTEADGTSDNIFRQAEAFRDLMRIYGCTQEELAEKFAVSQPYVAGRLRLLRFTEEERELILKAGLGERYARALLKVSDPEVRYEILRKVAAEGLTVRQTEEMADAAAGSGAERRREKVVLHDLRAFCNSISNAVAILKKTGVCVAEERTVCGNDVVITITITGGKTGDSEK